MANNEFNGTSKAWKLAVDKVIDAPNMRVTQVLYSLEASGADLPTIPVFPEYDGMPANDVHDKIRFLARDISTIMVQAFSAGKNNKDYL